MVGVLALRTGCLVTSRRTQHCHLREPRITGISAQVGLHSETLHSETYTVKPTLPLVKLSKRLNAKFQQICSTVQIVRVPVNPLVANSLKTSVVCV